jgi:hypothetical protein
MTPVGGGKGIEADLAVVHHVVGQPGQRLRLVYRLDVNHYLGAERAQLLVEHLEPVLG